MFFVLVYLTISLKARDLQIQWFQRCLPNRRKYVTRMIKKNRGFMVFCVFVVLSISRLRRKTRNHQKTTDDLRVFLCMCICRYL